MAKLLILHSPHFTPKIHHRTFTSVLSKSQSTALLRLSSFSSPLHSIVPSRRIRTPKLSFSSRAFDDPASATGTQNEQELENQGNGQATTKQIGRKSENEDYPSGEFQYEKFGLWKSFLVKLKMLFAYPWERIRKGSVLTLKLRGKISDQLQSRFSSGLSLPQLCENFIKAAHDPRISGIYLHIESLECGWGKVEEIRRHIIDFKKSGKFVTAYVPLFGEKEYYLASACEEIYAPPSAYFSLNGLTIQASFIRGILEKIGIEPEVERIGKYKSAGDQLMRKTMSEENCEMLTALLDNIYGNWMDVVASTKGMKREDMENFINEGAYKVEQLKEKGLITDIHYDDEVLSMLKKRLEVPEEKKLPQVDYRKYSRVRKWTLGLTGGSNQIAVIRTSGSISRVPGSFGSDSGIIAEKVIEKIRSIRDSKKYEAVIIRIDSPGGDALASDLMWREIRLLSEKKPVIASMSDVAASGGYYMAMACDAIVAESLTLTGSIGVVTGRFSFGKLFEKIGYNTEIISRGKFSEFGAANQRTLRPDEAELFAKSAQNAYQQFRDKAAFSRSMTIDEMEEVAQGRVWTGGDAASRGLVDAIGGFSRAVAIAKQKAKIPQDEQVTLNELSRPSSTLVEFVLSGLGASIAGVNQAVKELLPDMAFSDGVQARMDGIVFQRLNAFSNAGPIFSLIKDILSSL